MKTPPDTLTPARQENAPDFLTRQQVAKRLSVHPETVKRMQRAGKLTPFVFGANLVRYSLAEVQALIQAAKVATA
ncbi:MAG: helix-turn-helix domain-containing protein [Opitutaceae bacterium]|nr:helix-turn-helix domain-containing protein [Opitutaceae bacterium]